MIARGLVVVALALGTFLIFPIDCAPRAGEPRCKSIAGFEYAPGPVVAGLWAALVVALVWLVIRRPRR